MATQHEYRVHILVPESLFPATGTWWQNNIDPNDNGSGWPRCNPSGSDQDVATYREVCVALTVAQLRQVVLRLAQLAGLTPPTLQEWQAMTRAQKKAWLNDARAAIFAAVGVSVTASDNDGEWDDFPGHRLLRSLKPRQPARP